MNDMIQVNFDVPGWIARGLADGTLVRRGGVIQQATGSRSGEIAAWLRESGGLLEPLRNGTPAPSLLRPELERIGAGMQGMVGLQILTLSVVAIGFALVLRRLSQLDQKLDEALRGIGRIESQIAWLDRRLDMEMQAKVTAALETAEWAERTGRTEQLAGLVRELLAAEHLLRSVLRGMLEAHRAARQGEVFWQYFSMRALVGVGRARVHALLDGPQEGSVMARSVAAELRRWRESFQSQARELPLGEMVRLGGDGPQQLRGFRAGMEDLEALVGGYTSELEHCAAHGLSVSGWMALGRDIREPRLLLLVK